MSAQPTPDLASKYDPAAVEAEVYADWLKNECFTADPSRTGEPYSIVIPPPNVTGALHLGHAINNTLQDILIRVHRMRGFNTVWIPGIDHAGIATQAVVERQLKENENKTRHDVGRECLVKRIWAWKEQYGDRILNQLQRLGCSCDWSRTRFTLDDMCARAVRETFFKFFRDGLVYRGKRLVNWDTHLLTSISDDELYDEPVKTNMWSIKYKIVASSNEAPDVHPGLRERATHMVVATTRPETMLADTAVAVHSQDPRWNWAIGMFVELPLTGRKIPIIADDILVDPTFGSGVVKVTPAHDPNDYAVYTRHLGKPGEIGILNLMTPDGKVNDTDPSWAKYAGLTFAQARKRILEDLAAGGFHNPETDVKPHEANVKFSDRSKTAIQPYLSDQWFVKMAPLAEPALEVVRDGTIKFFPERHAQQYLSWLGEKRDWPISRQLWWGHRIPVWSAQAYKIHNPDTPHITQAIQDWQVEGRISLHVRSLRDEPAFDDQGNILDYNFICVRDPQKDQELVAFLEATGHVQDPDVLDTWFSSALWPHSTLGWPDATADLARWYPTSVLMTGRDIITLWVARMVMMGMYNMGTPNGDSSPPLAPRSAGVEPGQRPGLKEKGIPFAHVAINPTILDGKGERMSKSKGNGVDPVDIIDTHGADALRFTMTSMATETQDARMPVQVVCPHCGERFDNPEGKAQVVTCPKCKKKLTRPFENATGTEEAPLCKMTSKRFDEGRNFCTKLWNAARFVMSGSGMVASATMVGSNPNMVAEATMPQTLADRWIVSRFNRAVDESNTALATYRFDQYAKACYDFFWRDFCDWYLETAKPALKDPARSASTSQTLAAMLDGVLRLMHPMIPFITERLWWQLNLVRPERGTPPSEKLVLAKWPTAGAVDSAAEELFGKLQEIIAAIRNVRNEYNIKKAVTVSFSTGGDLAAQVRSNRELIETLAVCSINQIQENLAVPRNSARASAAGIDVFVEDVIDPDAEKIRISRQIDSLKQKITAMKARLANPSYADKAPAHLVQQTRDELAALEAELKKLEG